MTPWRLGRSSWLCLQKYKEKTHDFGRVEDADGSYCLAIDSNDYKSVWTNGLVCTRVDGSQEAEHAAGSEGPYLR